jgi:hypothetical protein
VQGEPLRGRDVFGASLGAAGAFTVGYFAPKTKTYQSSKELVQKVLDQPTCYVYLPCVLALGVAMWLYTSKRGIERLAPPLLISAASATFTVFAVKCISLLAHEMLSTKTMTEFKQPLIYFCIVCLAISGCVQIVWLNRALVIFPATSVVPTYYVLFTISAILVGGVLFRVRCSPLSSRHSTLATYLSSRHSTLATYLSSRHSTQATNLPGPVLSPL